MARSARRFARRLGARSGRRHRASLRTIGVALFALLGGCSRPEVAVPHEVGAAGMFCVTPADCTKGLGCLEQHCCSRDDCGEVCSSMMQKDSILTAPADEHHPAMDRYERRRCVALCCQGVSAEEIRDHLRAQVRRLPGHESIQAGDDDGAVPR